MAFETVPVLHLDKRAFPEYPDAAPERVLTELARRFGRVGLVDVEGVRANNADLEWIHAASKRRALWVDAGSRFATDAMDVLVAGASAVTVRWSTLRAADELEEAADLLDPDALFLALEHPGGRLRAHAKDGRGADALAAWAGDVGVGLVHVVDADADADFVRALPRAVTPCYVQGASAAVAAQARTWGYAGALVSPTQLPPAAHDKGGAA